MEKRCSSREIEKRCSSREIEKRCSSREVMHGVTYIAGTW